MSRPSKTNVPQAALRWSIERAGIEFRLTSATLRKALAKNSAVPDPGGLFLTQQVAAAIYGTLHLEKIQTQRARARKLELENAITTGSVLNRAALEKGFAAIADAFVSRLMAATEVPARAQTRLPSRNGKHPDEEPSES